MNWWLCEENLMISYDSCSLGISQYFHCKFADEYILLSRFEYKYLKKKDIFIRYNFSAPDFLFHISSQWAELGTTLDRAKYKRFAKRFRPYSNPNETFSWVILYSFFSSPWTIMIICHFPIHAFRSVCETVSYSIAHFIHLNPINLPIFFDIDCMFLLLCGRCFFPSLSLFLSISHIDFVSLFLLNFCSCSLAAEIQSLKIYSNVIQRIRGVLNTQRSFSGRTWNDFICKISEWVSVQCGNKCHTAYAKK